MRNWIRIFLVCFVLVGGTAFVSYQFLNQFNKALDDLSTSSLAIVETPRVSAKKKNEQSPAPAILGVTITSSTPEPVSIPTSSPETTLVSSSSPETAPDSLVLTDPTPSFTFPKMGHDVYIGCTYTINFKSVTTAGSLETALFDAGTSDAIEPAASGLARESEIEKNSQSLDWKIGAVWPGDYYIKASSADGPSLKSNAFTIRKMPKGISAKEKAKICEESSIL